jgi:hypothetical protein
MTESRTYITEDLWFPCDDCGKKITHHSIHTCSPQLRELIMNPDILPTLEEWRLVCNMVKQHELSDEEINQIVWQQNLLLGNDDLRKFARSILKKAKND